MDDCWFLHQCHFRGMISHVIAFISHSFALSFRTGPLSQRFSSHVLDASGKKQIIVLWCPSKKPLLTQLAPFILSFCMTFVQFPPPPLLLPFPSSWANPQIIILHK